MRLTANNALGGRARFRAWFRPVFALVLGLHTGGCTHSIVFSSSYLAGVEVIGADNGAQRAKVALQKAEGIAMPGCAEETSSGNFLKPCEKPLPKAYSALAFSDFNTGTLLLGGLTNVRIVQVVATGTAANAALDSGSAREAFMAIEATYDDSASTRCVEGWLDDDDAHPGELKEWWTSKGLEGEGVLLISGQGYDERRETLRKDKNITCSADGSYIRPQ